MRRKSTSESILDFTLKRYFAVEERSVLIKSGDKASRSNRRGRSVLVIQDPLGNQAFQNFSHGNHE